MTEDRFEDLIYGRLPHINPQEWKRLFPEGNTWTYMEYLCPRLESAFGSVTLEREEFDTWWCLRETINDEILFEMKRSRMTGERKESANVFGCIGLSQIDLSKRDVIITEGVSDYVMVKNIFKDDNVLGFTNLGGSALARTTVISLFDEVLIVSDNDSGHDGGNVGLRTARNLQSELKSHGLKAYVYIPETKDISRFIIDRYNIL